MRSLKTSFSDLLDNDQKEKLNKMVGRSECDECFGEGIVCVSNDSVDEGYRFNIYQICNKCQGKTYLEWHEKLLNKTYNTDHTQVRHTSLKSARCYMITMGIING